uniref:Phospholipid scramblase n=1 Tax=Caenorhabditis tropicalis TaxID=1561998 RepID=A0A1I7UVB8_9PELO
MSNIITVQPGVNPSNGPTYPIPMVQAAPGTVWMPLPPTIHQCPQGLEYLNHLDQVQIYQLKDLLEIVLDWETRNKYVMKNANGEQCYYALEESGCCERLMCGPQRGFTMHIVDNFKREVLTIKRVMMMNQNGCFGCCACIECCQHECSIETPSMGLLGTVRQTFACMKTNFEVLDAQNQVIFEIEAPDCCTLMGCQDQLFEIKSNGVVIGAITKKWTGMCREFLTDADTFFVNFPKDLDVKLKGVLIGATFLIDFMVFEKPKDNSGWLSLLV